MIILISGPQGSGKSSLANALSQQFGPVGAIKQRFAAPLYEMHNLCRSVLQKYGVQGYDFTKKDGTLLQLLGTEWGRRTVSETIWIDCMHAAIRSAPKNIVHLIEDCRFKNEFDSFDNVPDVIRIRLSAPEAVRKARCESWRDNTAHQSEIDLNEYAENRKFDMYFQTDIEPINEIVEKVMFKVRSMKKEIDNVEMDHSPI